MRRERVIFEGGGFLQYDEPEGCVDDVLSNPQRATEEALAIVHLRKPNQHQIKSINITQE